jgi:hypothetical protein
MNENISKFKNGVLGFFNNPSDGLNLFYFLGFVVCIVITGLLVNLVWKFFTKKESATSSKTINIGNNSNNNNIKQ